MILLESTFILMGQTSKTREILSNDISPSATNQKDFYPNHDIELVRENSPALESICF